MNKYSLLDLGVAIVLGALSITFLMEDMILIAMVVIFLLGVSDIVFSNLKQRSQVTRS